MLMIYIYVIFMMICSIFFFILSLMMFLEDGGMIMEWLFFSMNSINIEYLIYMDWLSVLFVSIVMFISLMVLVYSVIYMEGELMLERYYYLVMLFVFSMILMILSPNVISIMFGWDGLGLVSFCLVVFYQNYISYNSGMLTVLLNRLGDVMILLAIGVMLMYGSWNIFMINKKVMLILMFMLMIASMTKSAQMPFSSWLPRAMAAPTPVSALVHSSTLVTAGIYLMIRFNNLLMFSGMSYWLFYFSILTMLMSGIMANFEFDLKKIIALSTLSQLGLMMMILSVGFPLLAYYHLLTHAVFKSLLFMSAGIIIHSMNNNQDIRLMGGLSEFIPFTMMSFQVTLMALCGFPFFSGFYSKDLIMEMMYFVKVNYFMLLLSLISLSLTVMYSVRLMYYVFFGELKINSVNLIYESKLMSISMILLMIFSVILGSMMNWMFFSDMGLIFLSVSVKMVTLMMILIGCMSIILMKLMNMMKFYYLSYFFSSMWFLNYQFDYMVKLMMLVSWESYYFDKTWMDLYSNKVIFYLLYEYKNFLMFNNYKMFMFMFIMGFMLIVLHI